MIFLDTKDILKYMVFVDYKQAYDGVNRQELWKATTHFGIPQKYVHLVKMSNDKTLLKRDRNYHRPLKLIQGCSREMLYPRLYLTWD